LITDEKSKLNPAGSASIMVQKYLRPAAIKAGVIKEDERVRFGFHKLMANRNTVHRRTHSDQRLFSTDDAQLPACPSLAHTRR
jgi:hypothetical protein